MGALAGEGRLLSLCSTPSLVSGEEGWTLAMTAAWTRLDSRQPLSNARILFAKMESCATLEYALDR